MVTDAVEVAKERGVDLSMSKARELLLLDFLGSAFSAIVPFATKYAAKLIPSGIRNSARPLIERATKYAYKKIVPKYI